MKTAMITGASGGIGQEIARELAQGGYNLILTCHTRIEFLEKMSKDLAEEYGVYICAYGADFSNPVDIESLFQKIHSNPHVNGIDILINNAGISHVGLFHTLTLSEWNKIFHTNLTSAMFCSKHVLPAMIQNRAGKIINISSIWGCSGASMEVAYSTTKAGLGGFTKALAKEVAPSNIQVNCIACGLIDTPMNHCFSKEELDAFTEEIPTDRMGTTKEVALFVAQLLTSPTYLTGQVIPFDGGLL